MRAATRDFRLSAWRNLLSYSASEGVTAAGIANGSSLVVNDATRATSGGTSVRVNGSATTAPGSSGLRAFGGTLPIPSEGMRISVDVFIPVGMDSGARVQSQVDGVFVTSPVQATPGQWSRITQKVTGTSLTLVFIIGNATGSPQPTWSFWVDRLIICSGNATPDWWMPGT